MKPRFDSLDDEAGLEVVDPIESCRFVLYTSQAVSPTPADAGEFAFPVADACEIVTESITFPYVIPSTVRDATDGSYVLEPDYQGTHELPHDDHLIELPSAPLKLYLRAESGMRIAANADRSWIEFGGPTRVEVGARSFHTSPAETVTVPDDPEAVMAAVSTFGSALKTTSPERSFPTLRGHPPRIERGDELAIPEGLESPDTSVEIRVPPEYDSVLTVAPLSYYLGADLVPGARPRLRTDSGFVHRLDTERGFEDEVIRVLKQVFVLDCITRTEGFLQVESRERQLVEERPDVELDFPSLYDASLADRLEAYLSVPFTAIAAAVPTWDRVADVRPTVEAVELLPYVVNDLSIVRVRSPAPDTTSEERSPTSDALDSFKRGGRASASDRSGVPGRGKYVPVTDDGDALERAWVGDGTPVHGTKLVPAAFEHDRTGPTDGVITVTAICADSSMKDEWDAVSDVYGTRDVVPFDVEYRFDVTTDELREALVAETHLVHFVGHIDGRGFRCADGIFDARTLDQTGATAVLLNGCRSHDQGVELVERGARAAVVSLGDVGNAGAAEVGETFARLLNYGFDVGSALSIVETYTSIGHNYVAVGDPGAQIAQCEDGVSILYELSADIRQLSDDERVSATVVNYTRRDYPIGSTVYPHLQESGDGKHYLGVGTLDSFSVSVERLRRTLCEEASPFVVRGELAWSDELFGEK